MAIAYPPGSLQREKAASREDLMKKSRITGAAPSRRDVIKTAAVFAAGVAAPTFLRVGSALADYPDRAVKIVVANTPSARPISSAA
jgi:hypothetical protein